MLHRARFLQTLNPELQVFFKAVENGAEMQFIENNSGLFRNIGALHETTKIEMERFLVTGRHERGYHVKDYEKLTKPELKKLTELLHDNYGITSDKNGEPMKNYLKYNIQAGHGKEQYKKLVDSFKEFLCQNITEAFGKTINQTFSRMTTDDGLFDLFKNSDLTVNNIKKKTNYLDAKIDTNLEQSQIPEQLRHNAKTMVKDMFYGMMKRAVNYRLIAEPQVKGSGISGLFPGISGDTAHLTRLDLIKAKTHLDSQLNRAVIALK